MFGVGHGLERQRGVVPRHRVVDRRETGSALLPGRLTSDCVNLVAEQIGTQGSDRAVSADQLVVLAEMAGLGHAWPDKSCKRTGRDKHGAEN